MSTGMDAPHGGSPWHRIVGAASIHVFLPGDPAYLPADVALLRQILELAGTEHEALRVSTLTPQAATLAPPDVLILWQQEPDWLAAPQLESLVERATYVIAVGAAVLWMIHTGRAKGIRVAPHWMQAAQLVAESDSILSPAIIEHAGRWTTCCGGAAVIDLALIFLRDVLGTRAAADLQARLCVGQVRAPADLQRPADPVSAGHPPALVEAIALMEANLEEPLQADEIARLAGVSRRQLERIFRQCLGTAPSRHYMELRLAHAQRLIRDSRHSLLQIALMCGFSSGPHFSTAYRTVYGTTPREERQRILAGGAP
ncbi:GlxA family transcriptional regulator [Cupriavidus necator]|nr:helix-turn-helix domain-containing protein [Cupriavidus necator]MDX6007920.1 helix-turn-helix domain-containing protein [Cupriavidus necator]